MNNSDCHPRVLSLSSTPSSSIPATPAAHSRRASHESAHDAHHFVALQQQQENEAKAQHKLNLSIKKMWEGVKKHASEHHRSVNAAYMASYGCGAAGMKH
ncbi:hypothetical protein yc1106_03045 [Curvularia clavata]|uniref:Uncharacterized protein n=1 Tax=Curvularia clavata TaxID=95742 RepID=A0A9Q9DRV4_CURCL|nr:hypothetical protein yc1106_03045 [Curvularia clavata]